ncbi:hypothetical protein [Serratia ureilytica]|uniref:hypothetical protein n=1 Tax=Serratia ureilytica TaxID=300181 RepID=UPI0019D0A471|nr:hypothetical protein [Serratia ureilytica]MBN5214287.1 hypothetical protein [Serratia ureilytica]
MQYFMYDTAPDFKKSWKGYVSDGNPYSETIINIGNSKIERTFSIDGKFEVYAYGYEIAITNHDAGPNPYIILDSKFSTEMSKFNISEFKVPPIKDSLGVMIRIHNNNGIYLQPVECNYEIDADLSITSPI